MTDKMDAASTTREVDVNKLEAEEKYTKLEMSERNGCVSTEIEGSKGMLGAHGDQGSSSNKLDVNDNGSAIPPEIRYERTAVFGGRSGLPTKERSDSKLMEPKARDSLLVLHVHEGRSDALLAPEGGNHSGVVPENTDMSITPASLGRHNVMIAPEASDGLAGLPEVNDGLDVSSTHSNHLMVLPEANDNLDLSSEPSDHFLPELPDGLGVASEFSDHLLVPPEVNDSLDVSSEHSDHLMVLSELPDGLGVASELGDHLMVQPEVSDCLNDPSEHSDHLMVLPEVSNGLNDPSEHSDHLMVQPEVSDGLSDPSEDCNHLKVLPEDKDGLNDPSEHSDDLPITSEVRDGLISASEGSVETSNNLTMSFEENDVLNTPIKDGITSALRPIDENLITSEGGLDSLNTDDTSINRSRAVADSLLVPSDVQENVKQECYVCGICDLSLRSEVDLVKHQETHFINTESETSINASPCLDRPSRTSSEEEQFKCNVCSEIFSDPDKLSAHKLIHSVDVMKCDVCGKAFRTLDDLQHHKQMHSIEGRFSCDVCSEAFDTRSSLLNHQTMRHPCDGQEPSGEVNPETRYVCGHCKEPFPSEQDLLAHEVVHVDTKPFICSRCDKVFTSGKSLQQHLATHFKNKSYNCTKCETSFKSYYHLNRHRQVHKDRPFFCDVCRKMFKTDKILRIHSRLHKEESPICDKCNKKFKTKVELNRHKRSHKIVEKRHDCDVCNKSYKRAAHLKRHKLSHKGTTKKKPHSRRFSQKSYSKVSQLNRHLETRAKVKPRASPCRSKKYYCGICSSSFVIYYSMKKHRQIHKDRPYMCDICEETFLVGAELRRHKLRNCSNGYVCEVCNKSFSTEHQLQSHSIKHISLKPYMCSFCHKCFKTTKQLRNHMLLHTGSEPYICLVCNKRFAEIENLTRHQKICSIGLKSSLLSKRTKQAHDPPGMKQEEEPLPQYQSCTDDQSGFEASSRMDVIANEDYPKKTSDEQPISAVVGPAIVDIANSDQGSAMHVEMSCTEIFDYAQPVSADGESSQGSDVPNNAKLGLKEDCLIGGQKSKKLQVRLEKFVLYICDICDKSFASQDLWNQHMVSHIKEEPQGDQLPQKSLQHLDEQQKQESPKASLVKKQPPIKRSKPEARASFRCKECGELFPRHLELKLHMKAGHSGDQRHPCKGCGRTYKHKRHLRDHWRLSKSFNCAPSNEQALGKKKMLRCDICGEKFPSIKKYKDHMNVHLDEHPVKCDACGKRYKHKAGLEYHKTYLCNTTNDPISAGGEYVLPSVFNCEVCHNFFTDLPRFKDHIRSHSDARPFSCEACGKSYKYLRDVRTHELKACSKNIRAGSSGKGTPKGNLQSNKRGGLKQKGASLSKWKCKLCAKGFRTQELFKSHRLDCAALKKSCRTYKCDKCGKEFKRKIDMIQKHGCSSKPLIKVVKSECEVCGKGFIRMTSQGTELASEKCKSCSIHKKDVCKKTTKPKGTVQGPSGTNEASTKGSEEAQSKSATVPKFPCKLCKHIFAYKSQLKKHERHHEDDDERLFKCNKCDRNFTLLQTLQLHKRKSHAISHGRNTGRNKLKCRFCIKFFRFPYERERHENYHSSEKRYKCECGQAFKQKFQLRRHQVSENHPKVQPAQAVVKNSNSTKAAKDTKSSGKPTLSRKDSKQNILVGDIDSAQTQPQKLDPMCTDEKGIELFKCYKCYEKFSQKKVHKLHEQKCTTLKCRFCDLSFNNLISRKTHEQTHSGHGDTKLHKCQCGASYMNISSLRSHQVKNHLTKKCSPLVQNRVEHSETDAPSTSSTADIKQSPILPFKCQKCNKGFLNRYELQRHERTKKYMNGCAQVSKDAARSKEDLEGGRRETTKHQPRLETNKHHPGPSQQPQRIPQAVEKNVIRVPSGKNLVILKDNQKAQQNDASRYGVIVVQKPGTPQSVLLNTRGNSLSLESLKKYQQFVGSTAVQQSGHQRLKCQLCSKEYHNPNSLAQHEKTHVQEVHRCDCGKVFKHKHELLSHQVTGHIIVNSTPRQQNSIGLAGGATPTRMKNPITQPPLLVVNCLGLSGSPTNKDVWAENGQTPRVFNEIFKCEVCSNVWHMKWTPENDSKRDTQERACPKCGSVFSYKFHVKVSKKNIPQTTSMISKPTRESQQSQESIEDLPPLRSKDAFHVPSRQRSPVADVYSLTHGEPRQTRQFDHSENGEDNSSTALPEVTYQPSGSRDFNEGSQVSSTRSNLVDLLQEVPGPEKIRACRFCGKFFMKTYIIEHEQSHSDDILNHLNMKDADEEGLNEDRVFPGLRRSDAYNENMEMAYSTQEKHVHHINKPHRCERCGQRFEKNYHLTIHKTSFCSELKQDGSTAAKKGPAKEELQILKCGVCATFFNSMPLLVDHMKGHN